MTEAVKSTHSPFITLSLVRAYPRNNSVLWFCATFRIRQINARVKQQKRPCVMIAKRLMERHKTLARRSQNIHFQLQELGPKSPTNNKGASGNRVRSEYKL
jgi:hypothetical protein